MTRTAPYGYRARIGLIVPPNNTVNESEWMAAMPEGVTLHPTRMPLNPLARSEAELADLRRDLLDHCRLLAEAEINAIAFGCTAPSAINPRGALEDEMRAACGLPAATAAAAVADALIALGARRVSLLSPFSAAVTAHEATFLGGEGIEVLRQQSLDHGTYAPGVRLQVHRIAPEETLARVLEMDLSGSEAIVLSGTNLVTFPMIADLEGRLGLPVVSSNQALLWSALRKAGIADRLPLGRLFEL